jgi:glucose-6-phosphate 1-dehydrogenase
MPILEHWEADAASRPAGYPAGEWGPEAANQLIEATGRRWRPL